MNLKSDFYLLDKSLELDRFRRLKITGKIDRTDRLLDTRLNR